MPCDLYFLDRCLCVGMMEYSVLLPDAGLNILVPSLLVTQLRPVIPPASGGLESRCSLGCRALDWAAAAFQYRLSKYLVVHAVQCSVCTKVWCSAT